MTTYTANGETFKSFTAAVEYAGKFGFDVIEDATGLRRWTPGKISPKAARMYRERLAAYNAQKSA